MKSFSTPRLCISGVSKGSYAEVLGLAIAYLLKREGLSVSCCLVGSDFHLATIYKRALGRYVRLLDPRLLTYEQMLSEMYLSSLGADIVLLISPYAFYDGPEAGEYHSTTAELAIRSATPVILSANTSDFGNAYIPLIKGFSEFASGLNLVGLIANYDQNISSASLQNKSQDFYQKTLAKHFDLPLKQSIDTNLLQSLKLPLGIDHRDSLATVDYSQIRELINNAEANINIQQIKDLATYAKTVSIEHFTADPIKTRTRIAVAEDVAFCLGYQNNLELMRYFGAQLIQFSPLTDKDLPKDIGAIYFRGAILGEYGAELSKNQEMYAQIKNFVKDGGIVYAEGGATAYLAQEFGDTVDWSFLPGVGLLSFSAKYKQEEFYFAEAVSLYHSILGTPDLPVNFLNTGDWHLYRVGKTTDAFKIVPAVGSNKYDAFMPGANQFYTFSYYNFASNPELALQLVNAAEVAQGIS